ncbi:MAG: hypothetical protein IE926_00560 [Micrococcales bacterium]|nr:hypothetical protein [Micrococcales bacterium]
MTTSTSTRVRRLVATATVAAATLAGSAVLAAPASANDSPSGCGTPHKVNSRAITYGVGTSSWRVGTLTQYWGWCNSQLRNWAHVHFSAGNSAFGVKLGIQTKDGVRHGVRTVNSGTDFTSKPTATMDRSTRAFVDGTFWNGGVASLSFQATGWSG